MCAANSSAERFLPPLPLLWWWDDGSPRRAAENMAVDEWLLLRQPPAPVIRSYRWLRPSVTFGFAERAAPIRTLYPNREMTRRWTGGGVVEHGGDATYSLILPRACAPDWQNSAGVYARVHEAVAAVLRARGLPAFRVGEGSQIPGSLCFQAPVRHDVLVSGHKVAGAGQRRTREGLLHQGSLQGAAVLPGITRDLASALADTVEPMPGEFVPPLSDVDHLAARRYLLADWIDAR
jgi:lipoate-protein ligase A